MRPHGAEREADQVREDDPEDPAFIVFLNPSQSGLRLSQITDHSNEARMCTGR